ncbi:hypothetical protein ACFQWB_05870 [Paenibacillus thermoaerophilus]|uniref:Uncharacterized protein n=1 Tax=Paenibacillus thermoaerophilus TaxID=1215385 RepID=A0ABW2V008_9BACL|nr:hypothetical protein [Paenibacillus thermoaerophilus]TMV18263.1 hypothetical protein FE781_04780 [Paenibacillus thermoaerophilus]
MTTEQRFSLGGYMEELFGERLVPDEEGYSHILLEYRDGTLAVGMLTPDVWDRAGLRDSLVLEIGSGNRLSAVWYADGYPRVELGGMTVADAGTVSDTWMRDDEGTAVEEVALRFRLAGGGTLAVRLSPVLGLTLERGGGES